MAASLRARASPPRADARGGHSVALAAVRRAVGRLGRYSRIVAFVVLAWLCYAGVSTLRGHALEDGVEARGERQDGELTVIINTFRREDLLRAAVRHYSRCSVIQRIHVNWAESPQPPDLAADACCGKPLTFATPGVTHNDTSLNTRFLPVPHLATDAVLSIDDDITSSCATLERTLRMWKQHPDNLVGWFPRHVRATPGHGTYLSKLQTLLLARRYSVILTKGAIMHARHLQAYSEALPRAVRDMVAARRNCEDLAMQFLVSSRTAALPAFVWAPRVRDAGAGIKPAVPGISSAGAAHFEERSECVRRLAAVLPPPRTRPLSHHRRAVLLWLSPILDQVASWWPHGRDAPCACAE